MNNLLTKSLDNRTHLKTLMKTKPYRHTRECFGKKHFEDEAVVMSPLGQL